MPHTSTPPERGSAWETFRVFLRLGSTSFGGPIAHLGYFRTEFVQRRRWMDDREFADLVALCQFLPGPSSSQVGFAIGLRWAGWRGAFAAFAAFTLPSAALLIAFAYGASLFTGPTGQGLLTGLKVVAVAIVAQAVWAMARTLAPDGVRAGIAVVGVLLATLLAGSVGQIAALLVGVLAGVILCREPAPSASSPVPSPVSRAVGLLCLALFALLLIAGPLLAATTGAETVSLFDAFYRAGALVFGGGHVVLPLLQAGVADPGWVSDTQFLAGYGAAQAVPGPLFTFAAYLGALSSVGPGGVAGALIALLAIFLPGFLLLVGVLPFWTSLRERPIAQAAMRGAGAAVVGILAAALYSPVFTSAVTSPLTFCLAVVCFVLLVAESVPPWAVVAIGGGAGALLTLS